MVSELFLASKMLRIHSFLVLAPAAAGKGISLQAPEQALPSASQLRHPLSSLGHRFWFDYRVDIPVITSEPTVDQSA